MNKKSEIKIFVELDNQKVPVKIEWEADDADFEGIKPAKTLMLSLWDEKENVTLGIDLWTKEMTVGEMNVHYHQIFLKMADTFERATRNTEVANMMRDFSSDFAKKLELKK
ncbi:MAG: gliding motility protein GldC [Ignavibacteria bacterium]|nr:MAG: gliding motility protein GldC [Ignavibacteria bacterium]